MDKIKEILGILDMPENKQYEWIDEHCEFEGWRSKTCGFVPMESYGDLAFRLIEETGSKWFAIGACLIFKYKAQGISIEQVLEWAKTHKASREMWYRCQEWVLYQPAIIQIIAAIIAKKLAEKEDKK